MENTHLIKYHKHYAKRCYMIRINSVAISIMTHVNSYGGKDTQQLWYNDTAQGPAKRSSVIAMIGANRHYSNRNMFSPSRASEKTCRRRNANKLYRT